MFSHIRGEKNSMGGLPTAVLPPLVLFEKCFYVDGVDLLEVTKSEGPFAEELGHRNGGHRNF
jgi:hypothetical protein